MVYSAFVYSAFGYNPLKSPALPGDTYLMKLPRFSHGFAKET